MAIRRIRTDDDPCLSKKCREVDSFDERLRILVDDLFDTLKKADGVGLAAPQVGVLRRVCVIDTGDNPVELVNPRIIAASGTQVAMEGCLSFPGKSGYVERANFVTVTRFNRNGEPVTYETEALFARAVQHELDHLDGLTYLRLVKDPPADYKDAEEKDEA